jgi:hypothetical protein
MIIQPPIIGKLRSKAFLAQRRAEVKSSEKNRRRGTRDYLNTVISRRILQFSIPFSNATQTIPTSISSSPIPTPSTMPPKTTTTTAAPQFTTATSLVRSGLSLQLFGLIWGILIASTPFPRLALSAHLSFMTQGAMVVVAGLLLLQPSIIRLGELRCQIVYWGLGGLWVSLLADCANAFWGTKELASLVSFPAY